MVGGWLVVIVADIALVRPGLAALGRGRPRPGQHDRLHDRGRRPGTRRPPGPGPRGPARDGQGHPRRAGGRARRGGRRRRRRRARDPGRHSPPLVLDGVAAALAAACAVAVFGGVAYVLDGGELRAASDASAGRRPGERAERPGLARRWRAGLGGRPGQQAGSAGRGSCGSPWCWAPRPAARPGTPACWPRAAAGPGWPCWPSGRRQREPAFAARERTPGRGAAAIRRSRSTWPRSPTGPRPARDLIVPCRLRRLLRQARPDVVHAHGLRAGAFAALALRPVRRGDSAARPLGPVAGRLGARRRSLGPARRPALVVTVHNAPPSGRAGAGRVRPARADLRPARRRCALRVGGPGRPDAAPGRGRRRRVRRARAARAPAIRGGGGPGPARHRRGRAARRAGGRAAGRAEGLRHPGGRRRVLAGPGSRPRLAIAGERPAGRRADRGRRAVRCGPGAAGGAG